ARAAARAIDHEIKGRAMKIELGDERAPLLAILAAPGFDESIDDVITGAKRGLDALPMAFGQRIFALGQLAFDTVQQTAIYEQYAALEDGEARDARIAGYV